MSEQKEKKKKKFIVLLTDFNCLTRESIIKTLYEIRQKIKEIFKNHIGKENAISPYTLFSEVFEINPLTLDIYMRNYWYNVLKRVMIEMRKQKEIFIINNGYSLFVLKTKEEKDSFKKKVNRHIFYLNEIKKNATEWVNQEKWKEL
jgi:hypothetical protein